MSNPKPIHQYAMQLWDAMEAQSVVEDGQKLFRGSITQLFRGLGLSNSYYTPTQKLLVGMGAITQIQRGARGIESVYVLSESRPSEEELASVTLTTRERPDTIALQQRVTDIERNIGGIDIVRALADVERRLANLEASKESNAT